LATFCWTKSLLCNDAFYQGFRYSEVFSERFYTVCKSKNSVPCQPSGQRAIPFGRQSAIASSVRTFPCVEKLRTVPAYIRPDVSAARPDDPQRSTKALGFLSKTSIWEDRCNRPDDVDSRPDALIHKASIAIQIQTSGRQSAWSGRACIKYGNCVHLIDRQDNHPPGPDARSLYMEITCTGCTTIRMTGQHNPDATLKQERFSTKFWSHSCPSGRPLTTIRTAPSFIKPDAHFNSQPINRGP
jgi:hypothetical protein